MPDGATPVEGENFSHPTGTTVVSDPMYSNGQALKFQDNLVLSTKSVTITQTSNVVVRGYATQQGGSPNLRLLVDGNLIQGKTIDSATLTDFLYEKVTLAPGTYTIGLKPVSMDTGRKIFVDVVSFPVVVPPDTTPPETTIDSGPSGAINQTSATFAFSSSEIGSTFECSLDGAAFASCTSPASYSGLSDGSHTFQVRATDAAGNVDATPASQTFTVDTTPPVQPVITSGPSGSTISTNSVAYEFNSPGEAGVTYSCYLERIPGGGVESESPCISPKTYSNLQDGHYKFWVKAIDSAGNMSAYTTAEFDVDTTPAAIDAHNPNNGWDNGDVWYQAQTGSTSEGSYPAPDWNMQEFVAGHTGVLTQMKAVLLTGETGTSTGHDVPVRLYHIPAQGAPELIATGTLLSNTQYHWDNYRDVTAYPVNFSSSPHLQAGEQYGLAWQEASPLQTGGGDTGETFVGMSFDSNGNFLNYRTDVNTTPDIFATYVNPD